jgi:hypothetical protein
MTLRPTVRGDRDVDNYKFHETGRLGQLSEVSQDTTASK